MDKKHILITGASSGIGKELARQLARKGHRLSLVARREGSLEEVRSELGVPESLLVLKADVANFDEIQAAVRKAEENFGPIDVLIANAGVVYTQRSESMDVRLAKEMVDTNFLGIVNCVAAVTPNFVKRKQGHIVGISSLSAFMNSRRFSVYAATKAGVSSYLNSLRLELEPKGIRVTVISPGFVKTPMTEGNTFKMPLVLEVEDACRKIIATIEKGAEHLNFPVPAYLIIRTLGMLPQPLYKWAMNTLRI